PLSGVAVTAQRNDSLLFGAPDPSLTDGEGRFSTLVADGDWQLTFAKEGYLQQTVSLLEVTGEIGTLEVGLEPAVAIHGRVVRMDGSGVEGVQIYRYGTGGAATTADGSFSLPAISAELHEL